MSRRYSPGERPTIHGLQDEKQFHNRTYVGQVKSVNSRNGTMEVATGVTGKSEPMTIPLLGMSIRGFASSWMRYMPCPTDFVKVSYGQDNRPQCTGMTVWGNDNNEGGEGARAGRTAYHQGGYARLARLHENKDSGADLDEFVELFPGEWDMRSTGGAYIKGEEFGTLLLMGGVNKIELNKGASEIRMRTRMLNFDEGGVILRLGDVRRRLLLTDLSDTKVIDSEKAYELTIDSTLAPGVTRRYYECRIGDVWDADAPFFPTTGTFGGVLNQLHFHATVKDGGIGLLAKDVLEVRVDEAGNTDIHSQADVTIKTEGRLDLGREDLSTDPNDALVLGTTYRAAESSLNSDLSTAYDAWGIAANTLLAALLPLGIPAATVPVPALIAYMTALASILPPPTGPGPNPAGLLNPLNPAGFQFAISTFEAGASGYLSDKVFTE